jgi:uncharacterized protein (TIGR02679 family)
VRNQVPSVLTTTEAYRQQVTLNLPLREVVRIDKAYTNGKVVYVVENSGVYSALLDLCRDFCEEQGLKDIIPNPPLVCTHGQFKLASLLLLDKLAASGTQIYYSGHFDPEGLSMAERLLLRYPGQAKAWHYTLMIICFLARTRS